MKLTAASTKMFIVAGAFSLISAVSYLAARKVYDEELQKQLPAKLISLSLIRAPDLNLWHYCAVTAFCLAIAITIAGIMLRNSDS
jgi:hypothetical protein